MMGRGGSAWLVLVLTCVAPIYAGALVPSSAAPVSAPADDINAKGFDQLNACLASRDRADALYVVDVSGSLVANDPEGRRFEALEASVAQIGLLAEGTKGLEVEAAVSTFGDSFTRPRSVQDWSSIDGESAADVAARFRSRAEQAWREAGTSQGTNYEAALEGAQSVLAERGARSSACQVVFWFTDGLFALGDSYDEAATNAASRRMCRPGGIVDQLREQQTSVIALALSGPDVDAQLAQPQYRVRRGELQAMAVGRSRALRCGTTPVPDSSRSGIYLSVDDPVGLGGLFSGVAAQAAGCTPETLRAATPAKFRVHPGVNRFQVDISVDGDDGEVTVTTPSGTRAALSSGSRRVGDAEVSVTRMGSLATVTVVLDASDSSGVWSVDAGSGIRPASVTLYRCSDLRLEIMEPAEQLAGGESGVVEAVAVDSAGAPADLTEYRGPSAADPVRVTVTSTPDSQASVTVADAAAGRLRIELTPSDNTTVVELGLQLTPRLADAPEIELGQVSSARRLPVTPPGSFPTVTPAVLDLGRAVGLNPAVGVLEVRGSDRGASRVCIDKATAIEAPSESGTNRVATSAECLELEVGESREVEVSVVPETSVDGDGRATLPVTLVNADGEEMRQDVTLSWELERRIDQGTRLWLVALAILASLVLLALALAVVNRLLARFGTGDVRFATVPAEIDGEGNVRLLEQVGDVRPDYLYIGSSERRRLSDPSPSGIELRAKAPRTLGDPEFTAHAPTGARLVPPDGHVRGDGSTAPVTAGLGAGWLLQVSDADLLAAGDDRPTAARLTVYGRGDVDILQKMTSRCSANVAENGWPQVRATLAERAGTASATIGAAASEGAVDGMDTQRDVGAAYDEDPFGDTSDRAAWPDPDPVEQRPTSRRSIGRSIRRGRNAPDSATPDPRPLDEEDPFA